jgi:hypothetical protein
MSDERTVAEYVEILNKQGGYAHPMKDLVNHPPHYKNHPSGIECIQITETMNFCLGNAVKYIWRADLKGDAIEDLKKAVWYVNREIERRKALSTATSTKTSSRES